MGRRAYVRGELDRNCGQSGGKNPRAAFIIPVRKVDSGKNRAGGTLVWTPGGDDEVSA